MGKMYHIFHHLECCLLAGLICHFRCACSKPGLRYYRAQRN